MINFLLNPFTRIAGIQSLLAGIAILLLTALIASGVNVHLDGVIDLHFAEGGDTAQVTFVNSLLESLINVICMVVFIYAAGLILSKSSIRIIDVLGTQSMARFPFMFACVASVLMPEEKLSRFIVYLQTKQGEPVALNAMDYGLLMVSAIITLAMIVWMIVLMYRSYVVSCNVKGPRSVISFIICILLAEIVSKVIISGIW